MWLGFGRKFLIQIFWNLGICTTNPEPVSAGLVKNKKQQQQKRAKCKLVSPGLIFSLVLSLVEPPIVLFQPCNWINSKFLPSWHYLSYDLLLKCVESKKDPGGEEKKGKRTRTTRVGKLCVVCVSKNWNCDLQTPNSLTISRWLVIVNHRHNDFLRFPLFVSFFRDSSQLSLSSFILVRSMFYFLLFLQIFFLPQIFHTFSLTYFASFS